ncbi:MAG: helix-turn-helix domain-containing protein [Clostridia bacterium]|nr:helix-turn-helix domain-containing protein [Clostridia bacterium]
MERELSRLLSSVKEKTGIDIQCVSENGVHYASTREEYYDFPLNVNAHKEVVFALEGYTYFRFTFSANKFIGAIEGEGDVSHNYASLISGLIESSQSKSVDLTYDEQFSLIVTGNSSRTRTLHFMSRYAIPKTPMYAILVKCENGKTGEVVEFLRSYFSGAHGGVVSVSQDTCAVIKFIENDENVEFVSPFKQGELIKRFLYEELGMNVLVFVGGTVKSFLEVSVSYAQALAAEKMREVFAPELTVVAYKDFALARVLEEMNTSKTDELILALTGEGGKELINDSELMLTGEAFLNSNLNVSETARELYIHRNTLNYRLDKIEKLTGLDVRKFGDALNFKVIALLSKLKD